LISLSFQGQQLPHALNELELAVNRLLGDK
jgi:hypothetical protein